MTKAHVLALGAGGDDVADLDVPIRHDHSVDQELNQLPLLLECCLGESALDSPTEVVHGCDQPSQLLLTVDLDSQLALCVPQSLELLLQILTPTLVLR